MSSFQVQSFSFLLHGGLLPLSICCFLLFVIFKGPSLKEDLPHYPDALRAPAVAGAGNGSTLLQCFIEVNKV